LQVVVGIGNPGRCARKRGTGWLEKQLTAP
jgi:hypothetical protein